jgi:hypothetical protein
MPAPARMDAGTASQLIPGVRRTLIGASARRRPNEKTWVLYGLMPACVAVAFTAVGCSGPAPVTQEFVVLVEQDRQPAARVPVRLVLSDDTECGSPAAEGITDSAGTAVLKNVYRPSRMERYLVVVHPYAVCLMHDGRWTQRWRLVTGPAPDRATLRCELTVETACNGTVG